MELLKELVAYPVREIRSRPQNHDVADAVAVPLSLVTREGVLHFLSAATVFGTRLDVSIAELAIESFFPADINTGEIMRHWLANGSPRK